jgi:hypothetical protein
MVEKPDSERQLRELAKLRIEGTHAYDTELQKAVWQIASQALVECGFLSHTRPSASFQRALLLCHLKSRSRANADTYRQSRQRAVGTCRY